jgi:hypothetical protein
MVCKWDIHTFETVDIRTVKSVNVLLSPGSRHADLRNLACGKGNSRFPRFSAPSERFPGF